jgi:hypothetical protein
LDIFANSLGKKVIKKQQQNFIIFFVFIFVLNIPVL